MKALKFPELSVNEFTSVTNMSGTEITQAILTDLLQFYEQRDTEIPINILFSHLPKDRSVYEWVRKALYKKELASYIKVKGQKVSLIRRRLKQIQNFSGVYIKLPERIKNMVESA